MSFAADPAGTVGHMTGDFGNVQEFSDGSERVFFSEAEWNVMLNDPAFGYVLRCGHSAHYAWDGGCSKCFAEAERQEAEMEALLEQDDRVTDVAMEALLDRLEDDGVPF